jgi:hypothetical protein
MAGLEAPWELTREGKERGKERRGRGRGLEGAAGGGGLGSGHGGRARRGLLCARESSLLFVA